VAIRFNLNNVALAASFNGTSRRCLPFVSSTSNTTVLFTKSTLLHAKNVDLYLHVQGINTTTPSGKAMFGMMGVFAEFERSLIQERVKAGLQRAKTHGKRLGRPPVPPIQIEKIRKLRAERVTLTAIAKKTGVAVGKVHQAVCKVYSCMLRLPIICAGCRKSARLG